MEIYQQIIFISIFFSIVIALALLFKSKSNKLSNKFLAFHLFLTAWFVFDLFLNQSDSFYYIPHYFRIYTPLQYLIIPALYLHIRLLLFPKKGISLIDLIWLIPTFVQIVDLLPFYFLGSQEKIEYLNSISPNKLQFQAQGEGFIFPDYFHSLTKILLVIICDILIIKYLLAYYKNRNKSKIYIYKFQWGVILFLISVLFQILPYVLTFILNMPFQIVFTYSMSIGILSMSIYLIFTPGLIYFEDITADKYISNQNLVNSDNLLIEECENEENKFDLDDKTCENYKKLISEIMISDKLYKLPDCSLKMISDFTGIPSHHISIVMKKCINKRFNDYINELRIDDIIDELNNSISNHLTMDGVANNYGFKSKSTFYRAFKKYKGCTPKEYFQKN